MTAADVGAVVVDFESPQAPGRLTGVFGGINWGQGEWETCANCVACPGRVAWMSCSPEGCRSYKCRDFTFVEPSVLESFSATAYVEPGDLEVRSYDASGNLLEEFGPALVPSDRCGAYETAWVQAASRVEVCFEFGSDLGIDHLTYVTSAAVTTTITYSSTTSTTVSGSSTQHASVAEHLRGAGTLAAKWGFGCGWLPPVRAYGRFQLRPGG